MKKLLLTGIAALLLAAGAAAEPIDRSELGPVPEEINDWVAWPPEEFNRDYTGRLELSRGDDKYVLLHCAGKSELGCAYRMTDETCFVWIANSDVLKRHGLSFNAVYRHERAHCLGWHHESPKVTCWANSCE